jgi:hypothetical protein
MENVYTKANGDVFHLGLCMAGSISAGAYIAGVVDYLMEALENWERAKKSEDPRIPGHQVVIDLLGGSSGGGVTSSITYFALRDQLQHAFLANDGRTYTIDPAANILWQTWVELNERDRGPLAYQLLSTADITDKYTPSALNTSFIDDVTDTVRSYIEVLAQQNEMYPLECPPYINPRAELFISLFNITGIKYQLYTKANDKGNRQSFFSSHRDLAHFRWYDQYLEDGCIPLDFSQLKGNLPILLDAARATSAYPVGFRAVHMHRPAKYIWDHAFFQYKRFGKGSINLGEGINEDNDIYVSLHSDSGVVNNEPVELTRDLMYMIQEGCYNKIMAKRVFREMDQTEKMEAKTRMRNTSVIMIDPFPATDFMINRPGPGAANLADWATSIINAMNAQLLFDAKQALDAYDRDDYGLSIIAPSKRNVKPGQALACGSLGGFGGFLSKEFRIHDFFLGRHNCQSFLRKYFVVNLNEEVGSSGYDCVQSIIEAYKSNPRAVEAFGFEGRGAGEGKTWVPIIPDVTMKQRIVPVPGIDDGYEDKDPLPLYELAPLPPDFLNIYETPVKDRMYSVLTNLFDKGWQVDLFISLGVLLGQGGITKDLMRTIRKDLLERGLMQRS